MEKIYNRLFVCKYESAWEWLKPSIRYIQHLNENDLFIIYQIGEGDISAEIKRYVERLKGKTNTKVINVSEMSENDRLKALLVELDKYKSKTTYLYFLSDDSAYRYCSDKKIEYKKPKSFKNLMMAISDYNRSKKYENNKKSINNNNNKSNHNVDTKQTNQKQTKNEGKQSKNLINEEAGFEKKPENNLIEKDKTDETLDKNNKTENNQESNIEQNIEVVNEDDASALGDIISGLAEENINVSNHNNEKSHIDKERDNENSKPDGKNQSKPSGKDNNNQMPPNSSEDSFEKSLEDIEKEIFTGEFKNEDIKREYTALDNSKATTADLTFQRLVKGLKKYLEKDIAENATNEQFLTLIMTLLKSYGYEDFVESWKTMNIFPMDISEKEYLFLKDEASYYGEMCQLFYGKDKW